MSSLRPLLATTILILAGCSSSGGPPASQEDVAAVSAGNTSFAVDLYQQLRKQPGNIVFSPFSISTALAMTSAGARGETAEQIERVCHFPKNADARHAAFRQLRARLTARSAGFELSIANALWGQKGFSIESPFLDLMRRQYDGGFREVDFTNGDAAKKAIDLWANEQTRSKIPTLFDQLDANTVLVLANAIYMKADWLSMFPKSNTSGRKFHRGLGDDVNVQMMSQEASFRFADLGSFCVLELPYKDKKTSMFLFLPEAIDGLPALEGQLSASKLLDWIGKLAPTTTLEVLLPRYTHRYDVDLVETFKKMGMTLPFHEADFTGISEKREIAIAQIKHKAYIDVNEEGTEAAAVTGVAFQPLLARITPQFTADHPFLYIIRDNLTGTILFMGRIVDPSK